MNICIDQLRKSKREVPEENAPERVDMAPRPDEVLFSMEKRFAIDEAMAALPARQRMAINLCHFLELSNIEAAQIMDISIDAMESLLARGRRGLRDRLQPLREGLTGKMSDETQTTIN